MSVSKVIFSGQGTISSIPFLQITYELGLLGLGWKSLKVHAAPVGTTGAAVVAAGAPVVTTGIGVDGGKGVVSEGQVRPLSLNVQECIFSSKTKSAAQVLS